MNAFRNSVERQRPVKDIYFDLVKTKWDWMQSFVKPVISGGRLAVHPTNPPTFIEREKQIQFLIFQIFFHPQILCSLLWLQSTSTTEILTYKSNPHYEYCCYKYKVLVWLEMFEERNIFSLSIWYPIKDSRVCRLEWCDINVSLITLLKVNRNLQEIWDERKVCLK